ncbi:MAG: hypothetical protein JSS84_03635, partial [Bacteroidetes bacterium]|nr:hypothetical protein [Bacteroidota bacterium]
MKPTSTLCLKLCCAWLCALLLPWAATAQMNITAVETALSQDFSSMGTTSSNNAISNLPAGFRVVAGAATADWNSGATTVNNAAGTSGNGIFASNSAGGAYNMASGVMASSTDRALGFLTSSTFTSPRSIILKLHNNTGGMIGSLDLTWDYEKYRNGTRAVGWTFFHGNTSTPGTTDGSGDFNYGADDNNTYVSNPPASQSMATTLSGLSIPAGGNYYLRWTYTGSGGSTNAKALAIDNFSVTAHVPPPPYNDECSSAGHVGTYAYGNCAGYETTGTTAGATPSGGSCNATDNDVWYYFYASTGTSTFVNLTEAGASGMGIEVFADSCGGTSVYCGSGTNHTVPTIYGHPYYMRVSSSVPGGFTVCVSASTPNDECENATGLGTNAYGYCAGYETTGTTAGATPSGGSCNASDNDVWYYFYATTGTSTFVNLTEAGASGMG